MVKWFHKDLSIRTWYWLGFGVYGKTITLANVMVQGSDIHLCILNSLQHRVSNIQYLGCLEVIKCKFF